VIDDDPAARDLMKRFLAREGFQPVTADSGEEGLRLARSLKPSVILLDVLMPTMDGWSVITALKADPDTADIPVIMVTMTGDRSLGFSAGAAEFLNKPVDRNRLVNVLRRFTGDRGVACNVLIVDDDPASARSLRGMLEKEGCEVADAPDGEQALLRVAARRPAIILLDLMMPHMDGFEFAAELHANPDWRTIPVVVMTAKDIVQEDRRRLNGYVTKIVKKEADPSALLTALREILKPTQTAGAPAESSGGR
jgi:CheY-like chemotaxis protein